MNDRELLGATSKNRLLRILALGMAIWASPKSDPTASETAGLYGRANDFLKFIKHRPERGQ